MVAVAQALQIAEERQQEDPLLPYPGGPTSVGPAPSTAPPEEPVSAAQAPHNAGGAAAVSAAAIAAPAAQPP
eukprot:4426362-Lingulodinium_polyedra.AAC.1